MQELPDSGIDTVYASYSYILSDNVENLVLLDGTAINGTGNSLDNLITENAQDNVLSGAGGNDTLQGGAGDDTYLFGRDSGDDHVVELSVGGSDKILFDADIDAKDILFSKSGNDLVVNLLGDTSSLTIEDWFTLNGLVETFETDEGEVLYATDVVQFVDYLSAYTFSDGTDLELSKHEVKAYDSLVDLYWL